MQYLRIWADEEGETHLEEVTLPTTVSLAELWVTLGVPVDRVHFLTVRAHEQSPDWHCAPRRQFVIFLDRWVRITASDGEVRTLPAGSVVLAEDLAGRGHVTEHEPGDTSVVLIALDELDA